MSARRITVHRDGVGVWVDIDDRVILPDTVTVTFTDDGEALLTLEISADTVVIEQGDPDGEVASEETQQPTEDSVRLPT